MCRVLPSCLISTSWVAIFSAAGPGAGRRLHPGDRDHPGWYLAVFRDRRADLLARGEAAGHPADVAATLGLALSRLEAEAPAAAGLLRLLACLAPEPVPLALLLSGAQIVEGLGPDVAAAAGPLLGDIVAVGDAIATLRRYSLVTPAGDGMVLVHRLGQAITLA
jgi:hypothetical protein